jgi:hypothetical protein
MKPCLPLSLPCMVVAKPSLHLHHDRTFTGKDLLGSVLPSMHSYEYGLALHAPLLRCPFTGQWIPGVLE